MTAACYCDYDPPRLYKASIVTARKPHRCNECGKMLGAGERYERVNGIWERGDTVTSLVTCPRCLAVREYVEAHAPCFCWAHSSMLEDAEETIWRYGHISHAFFIGGMKRVFRARRYTGATP